ncbi:MAG: hypothetical protein SFV21_15310 [Rhodospirillaceae bacterium]|nr:hypothetical protein [Rhodospirillaceae bacterium]
MIVEGPALDAKGCWRCTMTRLAAGERIKVVVAIVPVDLVLVVTVI